MVFKDNYHFFLIDMSLFLVFRSFLLTLPVDLVMRYESQRSLQWGALDTTEMQPQVESAIPS